MKIKELRQKNPNELAKLMLDCKKELFNLRFQKASGELTRPHRIRYIRRSVAQAKTILKENDGK